MKRFIAFILIYGFLAGTALAITVERDFDCGPGLHVRDHQVDKDDDGMLEYVWINLLPWTDEKDAFAVIWYKKDGTFKRAKILGVEITDVEELATHYICRDAMQFVRQKRLESEGK